MTEKGQRDLKPQRKSRFAFGSDAMKFTGHWVIQASCLSRASCTLAILMWGVLDIPCWHCQVTKRAASFTYGSGYLTCVQHWRLNSCITLSRKTFWAQSRWNRSVIPLGHLCTNNHFGQNSCSTLLHWFPWFLSFLFFKDFNYLFLERGKGREQDRKRNISVGQKYQYKRETLIGCLLHSPRPGTKPTTQACVLTSNRTSDFLLCGAMPSQWSHTSQGHIAFFSL